MTLSRFGPGLPIISLSGKQISPDLEPTDFNFSVHVLLIIFMLYKDNFFSLLYIIHFHVIRQSKFQMYSSFIPKIETIKILEKNVDNFLTYLFLSLKANGKGIINVIFSFLVKSG